MKNATIYRMYSGDIYLLKRQLSDTNSAQSETLTSIQAPNPEHQGKAQAQINDNESPTSSKSTKSSTSSKFSTSDIPWHLALAPAPFNLIFAEIFKDADAESDAKIESEKKEEGNGKEKGKRKNKKSEIPWHLTLAPAPFNFVFAELFAGSKDKTKTEKKRERRKGGKEEGKKACDGIQRIN